MYTGVHRGLVVGQDINAHYLQRLTGEQLSQIFSCDGGLGETFYRRRQRLQSLEWIQLLRN